jgi:large subunit ribosomal protein L20
MRALFINRISAAAKANGMSYSTFIHGLAKANVQLNRKMLSQIAIYEPEAFTQLTQLAQK